MFRSINQIQWILFILFCGTLGCDKKGCQIGLATGQSVACAAGAVGAVAAGSAVCAVTFGIGCIFAAVGAAAGTALCGGLGAAAGIACNCPSDPENFPSDEEIEKIANEDINNLSEKIDLLFPRLSQIDQRIVAAKVEILNGQTTTLTYLNNIELSISSLKNEVNLNQIISAYSRYLSNLDNVDSYYQKLQKENGMFHNSFRTTFFINAVFDTHDGAYVSIDKTLKMLGGGSVLQPESIYKTNPEFCTEKTHKYFSGVVERGMAQFLIAMEMENRNISEHTLEKWTEGLAKFVNAFATNCRQSFLRKVAANSRYKDFTKRKMTMLLERGFNFEPNSCAAYILDHWYLMEDVTTLLTLNEKNMIKFAHYYDNIYKCVNPNQPWTIPSGNYWYYYYCFNYQGYYGK